MTAGIGAFEQVCPIPQRGYVGTLGTLDFVLYESVFGSLYDNKAVSYIVLARMQGFQQMSHAHARVQGISKKSKRWI